MGFPLVFSCSRQGLRTSRTVLSVFVGLAISGFGLGDLEPLLIQPSLQDPATGPKPSQSLLSTLPGPPSPWRSGRFTQTAVQLTRLLPPQSVAFAIHSAIEPWIRQHHPRHLRCFCDDLPSSTKPLAFQFQLVHPEAELTKLQNTPQSPEPPPS